MRESFDRTLDSNFLTKFANKKKYWGMYCDHYPIITEKGGGQFPQMYAEEFVKGYERSISEAKRLGGLDTHLKETVVLDKNDVNVGENPIADNDPTDPELAVIDVGKLDASPADDDEVANG